jgi:hypothetical protein
LMFFITSSVLLTLVFICLSVRIEKQKVWHQQQNRLSESGPTKILESVFNLAQRLIIIC